MYPLTHSRQHTAQSIAGSAPHGSRISLLHCLIDICSRHQTCAFLIRIGKAETAVEYLFIGSAAIEGLIGCLDFLFFLLGEPIALTMYQLLFELGIELVVIDGRTVDGMGEFHADESSTAGGIREQVTAVAGADEGGNATQWFGAALVSLADIQRFHLHQVLEQRHLLDGQLVEFIEIDQTESSQFTFCR